MIDEQKIAMYASVCFVNTIRFEILFFIFFLSSQQYTIRTPHENGYGTTKNTHTHSTAVTCSSPIQIQRHLTNSIRVHRIVSSRPIWRPILCQPYINTFTADTVFDSIHFNSVVLPVYTLLWVLSAYNNN